jgi:hypothetical protein
MHTSLSMKETGFDFPVEPLRHSLCSKTFVSETRKLSASLNTAIMKNYVRGLHLKRKLGDRCQICGNKTKAPLQFHHVNPREKRFQLGGPCHYGFDNVIVEAKKCVLLCEACHARADKGTLLIPQDIISKNHRIIDKVANKYIRRCQAMISLSFV